MAADWENARYCSKSCRSHRAMHNKTDKLIEASFLTLLLDNRSHSDTEQRKITCEAVQEYDGGDRVEVSWRERYRRASRRLANVREVCWIERFEQGKWHAGDGKGSMRVGLREGKEHTAQELVEELVGHDNTANNTGKSKGKSDEQENTE